MFEIFCIAAGVAMVFGLLWFASAAGFVAICLVAGAGLGGFLVLIICIKISDKRQEREEQRRARDHQRMMELINAWQNPQATRSPKTLTIEQYTRALPRVGKR